MSPDPGTRVRAESRGPQFLRGRGKFRDVFLSGTRIAGKHVSCTYLLRKATNSSVIQAAFAIRSSSMGAVSRNKFKRLMREAYRRLYRQAQNTMRGITIEMIFTPHARTRSVPAFGDVYADMDSLLQSIASSTGEKE